jgi:hypothetical protein
VDIGSADAGIGQRIFLILTPPVKRKIFAIS